MSNRPDLSHTQQKRVSKWGCLRIGWSNIIRSANKCSCIREKKVGIRILNLGMGTETPTGKLMLTVLAKVAQFEREIMLERQRKGVAKAKAAGKYKGGNLLPRIYNGKSYAW